MNLVSNIRYEVKNPLKTGFNVFNGHISKIVKPAGKMRNSALCISCLYCDRYWVKKTSFTGFLYVNVCLIIRLSVCLCVLPRL